MTETQQPDMRAAAAMASPETVAELLANVRDFLRTEDARAQGFETKNAWLAGFAGVILSLTAALGWARTGNDRKAAQTRVAFGLLLAGLASVAGQTLIIGIGKL